MICDSRILAALYEIWNRVGPPVLDPSLRLATYLFYTSFGPSVNNEDLK